MIMAPIGSIPGATEVAEVLPGFEPMSKEAGANARLIAAAPELLEVLQQFVERCGTYQFHTNGETAIAARAAITKATGTNI